MARIHRGYYGYRRGARLGYGRTMPMSKGAIKCYAISGVILLILSIVMIVFGVLLTVRVFAGAASFIGMPLLSLGIGIIVTGLILLMMACQGAMHQGKATPTQTTGLGAGQQRMYPTTFPAAPPAYPTAFPGAPSPPPPFQSATAPAAQPLQPPPYTWTTPAPFGGTPASSVQGPYSGFQYTSVPDSSATGNSIPPVSS